MFGCEFSKGSMEGLLQEVKVADYRDGWEDSWRKLGEFVAVYSGD